MRTSRMTRAAGTLVVSTAVASALLPAAVEGRPTAPERPPMARAAGLALAVSSLPADPVMPASALLHASVTVSLLNASVGFQYGTTTSYGLASSTATTALLGVAEEVRIPITGLSPNTTYHYRAVVWSGTQVRYGRDEWFTTPDAAAEPATDPSAAPVDPGTSGDTGSGDSGSGSGAADAGSDSDSGSGDAGSGTTSTTTTKDSGSPGGTNQSSSSGGDASSTTGVPPYDGPEPVLGETVGAQPVKGTVTFLSPAGAPVALKDAEALPTGTIVDTTKGIIALTSATGDKGATQTGRFWGGVFEVRQSTAGKGMTQLVLRGGDFSRCPASTVTTDAAAASDAAAVAGAAAAIRAHAATAAPQRIAAHAATTRKPPRRLWGSDNGGRFETRGRGSVATVRGTRWVTEDWCQGTVTRVLRGAVSVFDLHRGRARLLRQGRGYFARIGDV